MIECYVLYELFPIVIAKYEFLGNVIQCEMSEFDTILGMESLTAYGAIIECRDLKLTMKSQESREVCFYGERLGREHSIISIMTASMLLRQGYIGYLCYATETEEDDMEIEDVPEVCEFFNVFSKELPATSPKSD